MISRDLLGNESEAVLQIGVDHLPPDLRPVMFSFYDESEYIAVREGGRYSHRRADEQGSITFAEQGMVLRKMQSSWEPGDENPIEFNFMDLDPVRANPHELYWKFLFPGDEFIALDGVCESDTPPNGYRLDPSEGMAIHTIPLNLSTLGFNPFLHPERDFPDRLHVFSCDPVGNIGEKTIHFEVQHAPIPLAIEYLPLDDLDGGLNGLEFESERFNHIMGLNDHIPYNVGRVRFNSEEGGGTVVYLKEFGNTNTVFSIKSFPVQPMTASWQYPEGSNVRIMNIDSMCDFSNIIDSESETGDLSLIVDTVYSIDNCLDFQSEIESNIERSIFIYENGLPLVSLGSILNDAFHPRGIDIRIRDFEPEDIFLPSSDINMVPYSSNILDGGNVFWRYRDQTCLDDECFQGSWFGNRARFIDSIFNINISIKVEAAAPCGLSPCENSYRKEYILEFNSLEFRR